MTFPTPFLVVALACLIFPCSLAARDPKTCHSVDDAKALFLRWVSESPIPGEYTTAEERLRDREHQGDLSNNVIFSEGRCGPFDQKCHGGGAPWPHTKANPLYTEEDDEWESNREDMVAASAWLLRRGMSRLQDTVLQMLGEVPSEQVDALMVLARRALTSFEDFWRQLQWTVAYGARQVHQPCTLNPKAETLTPKPAAVDRRLRRAPGACPPPPSPLIRHPPLPLNLRPKPSSPAGACVEQAWAGQGGG